ncbi:MAG TPA: HlyD family efflux transporter periplasmic adaptor subunit [Williamwhitmania sp.]|nr:HlyD family efflux transporter periplasmic adaptor subunit [Williamwhitmania sp.]
MPKNIDLRSDEINELLGTPPRWIIRGGIGVIFTIILLLFVGSIFFRYPEVINAPVVITTENPPAMVSARATGRLSLLKVADGANVNRGDTLAIVQNPAAVSSIRRLKDILQTMSSFFENYDAPLLPSFSEPLQLGEVQTSYAALVRAADDYRIFVEQGFYPKKMEALGRERKEYGLYYKRLNAQLNIMKMDMRIASKQFRRDSTLFSMKNISASDYEKAEQLLLSKKYSLEQSRVSLSDASITMAKLDQDLVELGMAFSEKETKLKGELKLTYEQLKASVSQWEEQYLLCATVSGRVSFLKVWSENQEVKVGETVFAIVPKIQGKLIARISLPSAGAGKVKVGQQVNIRVDGFPYMEFGMLMGTVSRVSVAPSEGEYSLVVSLPHGLTTSYGKKLELRGELAGSAEITTEDLSLLQRLLYPLKHLFTSRVAGAEK